MNLDRLKRVVVVCGHYGSGKTNVCVNLAIEYKRQFPDKNIYIADLDIVNPYFRTADAVEMLKENGVFPLIPELANTNLDIPSLPHQLNAVLTMGTENDTVFIDVGGDDGAVVLGTYEKAIEKIGYDMIYVVSMYRPLTAEACDTLSFKTEIEGLSLLKCNLLVNNSSIGEETTAEDFVDSIPYGIESAKVCNLELLCHSVRTDIVTDFHTALDTAGYGNENILEMKNATKRLF